jgi:alkanesulfonate monooxygenase SsuD/methylene tetrahydromethanopterin reductase-like flavin-dependent oxidoreductase (luciferase family)
MIEIGVFHNGGITLGTRILPSGTRVPDGNLAEIHAALQKTMIGAVRQGILADRVGFDSFYATEHHFQIEGCEVSPNPLMTEMAIAAQTKRIRLGQATNVFPSWHPIRFAEQAAMLDLISGGRLDCGIGRGYQGREVDVLGAAMGATTQDQERNRVYFEECFEIIMKAWTEVSISHQGEFFSIPPRYVKWNHPQTIAMFSEQELERSIDDVLQLGGVDDYGQGANAVEQGTTTLREISVFPQPLQKPYPPFFMPAFSRRTAHWAAENEHGVNVFAITAPASRVKGLMDIYHESSEAAGWPDRHGAGTPWRYGWDGERRRGTSFTRAIHISDPALSNHLDRYKEGVACSWEYLAGFGFLATLNDAGEPPPAPGTKVTMDFLKEKGIMWAGSKDEIIESVVRERETLGAEDLHIMFWFETNGIETELVEEQMQFFGEEIAPVLRREFGGGVDLPDGTTDLNVAPRAMSA